jgi:hypothetical protein
MKKTVVILFFILNMFSASSQDFNQFWSAFKKNIDNKEFLLNKIDFPYIGYTNYLQDDITTINKKDFQEHGPEIYANGNAFPVRMLARMSDVTLEKYDNHSIFDALESEFLKKYKSLGNLYIVDGGDTKAYFIKKAEDYFFIGFQSLELGD